MTECAYLTNENKHATNSENSKISYGNSESCGLNLEFIKWKMLKGKIIFSWYGIFDLPDESIYTRQSSVFFLHCSMIFTNDLTFKIIWLKWILNLQNIAKILIETFMGDNTHNDKLFFFIEKYENYLKFHIFQIKNS